MAQSSAWLKQSSNGRREFSTLTCGPNFDNVRHDRLLEKVARRVDDADIMHLLKMMLKASGKKGVPQGGVISPLLSNLYLNEVDKMLERAQEVTRNGKYTPTSNTRDSLTTGGLDRRLQAS